MIVDMALFRSPLFRATAAVVTIVGALAGSGCAQADPSARDKVFAPDEANCKPAGSAQAGQLASEWTPFASAIRVCEIHDGNRPAQLLVISVWADIWLESQPSGTELPAMPAPLLITPDGRILGVLPSNFPTDPPAELRLRFTDWKEGIPREIRLCLRSATPAGDQPLAPLRYQPVKHRYEAFGKDPEASLKDECHAR